VGSGNTPVVILPDTLTAGWTKITSLPNENFTDILFTDNSNGYAVSNNGIYKSINAGDEWTKISSTNAIDFVSIGTANFNNACFVNKSYFVFFTQDGGSTISNASYAYPGGGNVYFFDCFFSSAGTCYLSSKEYLWKSVDAGITLDTIYHFSNLSETSSLFFLDDTRGWVVRQDGIYHTTDAGVTWSNDTTLVNAYGSIHFLDDNNGYFSNYGTVNKTTDGGITWLQVYPSPAETAFQVFLDIDFINVNEGYFNLANKIYKTSDGGSSWTPVVRLGNEVISKICFTDANHGWGCTSDGVVVRYIQ
jgi:photosystem II stability/assembly factor-like uncharacterized protein